MFGFNWVNVAIGAIGAFFVSFLIGALILHFKEASWEHKYSALRNDMIEECNKNKRITEDNTHEYQNDLNTLDNQFDDLKRMYEGEATLPATSEAAIRPEAPVQQKHVIRNEQDTVRLLSYGKECEEYRLQVISLQKFINTVWEQNKN